LRDAIDLGVHDRAVDLDRDGLLSFADVGEFGFHRVNAAAEAAALRVR
jgi:hypothetical protein